MEKQIQIQFRLVDVQQVQYATLCNEWPQGEQQVTNQLQFSSDTQRRAVRCLATFEYKQSDITNLILSVQSVFEFSTESWSAMYQLQKDEWVLPTGLVQHLADITIASARGILAVRTEESGFPRVILPLIAPQQVIKNDLHFARTKPQA